MAENKKEIQRNNTMTNYRINLPLLFANGYPSTLEKMSDEQLTKFISFMVQCSLNVPQFNFQNEFKLGPPEWWPINLQYPLPLVKPTTFSGNWRAVLQELIVMCYKFHNYEFLIHFSEEISSFDRVNFKYVANSILTTSIINRKYNELLVTVRNENIIYDQPQRLLQWISGMQCISGELLPGPFDIYLCDYCDGELYSSEAMLEHEKSCCENKEDRMTGNSGVDVIACAMPQQVNTDEMVRQTSTSSTNSTTNNCDELREAFMSYFNLMPRYKDETEKSVPMKNISDISVFGNIHEERVTRHSHTKNPMLRYSSIPLTSPAGQFLLKETNSCLTPEYINERLEYIEKYCKTPLLGTTNARPQFMEELPSTRAPRCTYKKSQQTSGHKYTFPCRQFSQIRHRSENLQLARKYATQKSIVQNNKMK